VHAVLPIDTHMLSARPSSVSKQQKFRYIVIRKHLFRIDAHIRLRALEVRIQVSRLDAAFRHFHTLVYLTFALLHNLSESVHLHFG